MSETQNDPTSLTPSEIKAGVIKKISGILLQRREARGISIEKVYESTKIRPQTIKALESGNWGDLPGDVYVRGFLTRYAQFLGMNPQELLNPYFELAHHVDVKKVENVNQIPTTDPSRLPWIWGGVGVFIFIAVIKFIGVHMTSSKTSAPVAPVAVSTLAPVVISTPVAVPVAPPPVVRQKHRITVFTPNELWLSVISQTKTFEGNIPQNTTWTFVGEGNISIRLGHTKEITAYYDNRPLNVTETQRRIYQFNDH